jgi:hypothetical protein
MSLVEIEHAIIDVLALSAAVLELIHVHRSEGSIAGRRWIIPTLIAVLATFGSIGIYNVVQHRIDLKNVRDRIVDILQTEPRTFDEILHKLPYEDLPLVSEALGDLTHARSVTYEDIVLAQHDDSIQHEVRLYCTKKDSGYLTVKGDSQK